MLFITLLCQEKGNTMIQFSPHQIQLLNSSMDILQHVFLQGLEESPLFKGFVVALMKRDPSQEITPETRAGYREAIYNFIMLDRK